MPPASRIVGRLAARALRPAPPEAMPNSARLSIVSRMPVRPASPMWLLASETQSMPALARPSISAGSAEKDVPEVW